MNKIFVITDHPSQGDYMSNLKSNIIYMVKLNNDSEIDHACLRFQRKSIYIFLQQIQVAKVL